MKKAWIIGGVVVAILVALGIAGYGYAQSQIVPDPLFAYGRGYGRGMIGQYGGRGGMMGGGRTGGYGPLHEYMINAVANEFGVTPVEVEALHEEGKTMWDYAKDQGLTEEQFREKMVTARTSALEKAVADGVITQEQADWMLDRMDQMWQYRPGLGPCHGGGGFGGRGPGWRSNTPPANSGG